MCFNLIVFILTETDKAKTAHKYHRSALHIEHIPRQLQNPILELARDMFNVQCTSMILVSSLSLVCFCQDKDDQIEAHGNRSEERRVGKECKSRESRTESKKEEDK